ncbi:MAG: M14 family zinc carboxypeptidase [Planctomycetota bacterium]
MATCAINPWAAGPSPLRSPWSQRRSAPFWVSLCCVPLLAASCVAPTTRAAAAMDAASTSEWQVVGTSAEGRPVRARTLGRGDQRDGRRVAVIAGIHGDETEGLQNLTALITLLAESDACVRLIEDVSPDGTARGTRHTASGVDPNRNWPAHNFTPDRSRGPAPLSEPEVAAVHDDLVRFAPELVVVLHSTKRGPFVNYDGPARALAERFASAARAPWRVVADMGYATPGSFGTWMGIDRGVPTLTVEFKRGDGADVTGPPLMRGLKAVLAAFLAGAAAPDEDKDEHERAHPPAPRVR